MGSNNTDNRKGETMKTEVIGRNGFAYEAINVAGDKFVVGKYIVRVVDGKVDSTVCKATKANIERFSK